MLAWLNFAALIITSLLFLYYYVRSVSPAGRAQVVGPRAYADAGRDRIIASVFELIAAAGYVVYFFYPLPVPLPGTFPWPWPVSVVIAVLIAVPAGGLMAIGLRDAGEEAMRPKPEQVMYRGIYRRIRHPQAAGEVWFWWVFAFLLNSPFLALYSFIYIPIFLLMCWAEEQDLLLRYGEAYAEYYRRTGAFWPRLRRGSDGETSAEDSTSDTSG
jgi:methanethiol S-methyltransferase